MKLLDPAAFQVDILNFELVSRKTAALTALYLPWLEILCGIALIGWIKSSAAPLLLSFLMFIFIAVIGSAWIRELDVSCGCFGASDTTPNYFFLIVRNLLILCGLIAVIWIQKEPKSARLDRDQKELLNGIEIRPFREVEKPS